MKLLELREFCEEAYKFLRYGNPPIDEQLELWLPEVDHIPSEALPWIMANIKSTKDTLPKNLPRMLKRQWKEYQNAHPEKFTQAEESPDYNCSDCHGGGVLHFKAPDLANKKNPLIYTYVAICNSCAASHKKFGRIQHEGGKTSRKNEAGAWIPDGPYISPMMKLTKQEIIDKGYIFLPADNPYAEKIDEMPKELSYSKLKKYETLIRREHHEDLARQGQELIDEGFTKHEAVKAVNQAIVIRAKQARQSTNPGDIIKELFDI